MYGEISEEEDSNIIDQVDTRESVILKERRRDLKSAEDRLQRGMVEHY